MLASFIRRIDKCTYVGPYTSYEFMTSRFCESAYYTLSRSVSQTPPAYANRAGSVSGGCWYSCFFVRSVFFPSFSRSLQRARMRAGRYTQPPKPLSLIASVLPDRRCTLSQAAITRYSPQQTATSLNVFKNSWETYVVHNNFICTNGPNKKYCFLNKLW